MRWMGIILALGMLLGSPGVEPVSAQRPGPCGSEYVVRPGDYLSAIAARCGVRYAALRAANPEILKPSLIQPGEVLRIPPLDSGEPAGAPVTGGSVYLAQAGDELGAIASRFGVRAVDLASANPGITASSPLFAGMRLTLPQGARQIPTASLYPASGVIGTSVTLAATGFGANQPVRVRFGQVGGSSAALEVLNTDANGAVYKQYAVPYWPEVVRGDGQYVFYVERTDAPSVIAMSNVFYLAGTGNQAGSSGTGVPVTGGSPFYVVQAGDTLNKIAAANGMSADDLLALNPAIAGSRLVYPGQRLFLAPFIPAPVPAGPMVSVTPVFARPGDTLEVRAENFPPGALVDVRIARQGQSYSGVVDAQADARGVVSARIPLPQTARPGEIWVVTVTTTEIPNSVRAVSGAVTVR